MAKAQEAASGCGRSFNNTDASLDPGVMYEIEKRFGEDLTYENDNSNPAISPAVLRHFKKLYGARTQYMAWPDDYWMLD